ncbi:MAG TPA: TetR/AcrR family transcriptional regulator [Bacillales bacterium]|nr:TetR/AcrR family transcriptional regulator [Bacillales bacterium]
MTKKSVPSMVKDERLIEKRRNQMVKAAAKLFSKKGFHRTTTREIAKESGFSIGTLYEYIRSKEDILYLVCDAIYDQVSSRLKEEMDHERDGLASLKQAIVGFFKVVDDLQDEVLVMYQEANALGEALPYVLKKELEMAAMFEDILTHCMEAGELHLPKNDVRIAAHNILVCGQMWTFRRWILRRLYTVEEYAELQVAYLLRGMTGKAPAQIGLSSMSTM